MGWDGMTWDVKSRFFRAEIELLKKVKPPPPGQFPVYSPG